MRRLSPALLSASLVASAFTGCSDDDEDKKLTDSGTTDSGTDAGSDAGSIDGGNSLLDASLDGGTTDASTVSPAVTAASSKAADLRVTVNYLLGEHLILAAKATGAALGGEPRAQEYAAYGALLNQNGIELGNLIGSAFGDTAKSQFNAIWSAHNGYFVDYTVGVATNDAGKKATAVTNLTTTYVNDFSALISGATGLPLDAVKMLTTEHVVTTKAIVDAQGAQDWPGTYTAIRIGYAHMKMIGDPLAKAVAGKLPAAFPGDIEAKSVGFRVALNQYLQEHLYLASFATGAAIQGRTTEFDAAGAALNKNGTDLGAVVETYYGKPTADSFNSIWSAHNGYFVAYTTAAAAGNEANKTAAVNNLVNVYVKQFSDLLAAATGIPAATWTPGVMEHVVHTKDVVDAQVLAKATPTSANYKAVADKDLVAGKHMQQLGDPLAKGIVAKIPEKF
jgi:hypothetical protein